MCGWCGSKFQIHVWTKKKYGSKNDFFTHKKMYRARRLARLAFRLPRQAGMPLCVSMYEMCLYCIHDIWVYVGVCGMPVWYVCVLCIYIGYVCVLYYMIWLGWRSVYLAKQVCLYVWYVCVLHTWYMGVCGCVRIWSCVSYLIWIVYMSHTHTHTHTRPIYTCTHAHMS